MTRLDAIRERDSKATEDAEFIAASRRDIALLLAVAEAARKIQQHFRAEYPDQQRALLALESTLTSLLEEEK